ncbi:trehalose synthase [Devosia geojensis]|uniref:Alpha-amylase n=1 Tax=Devosia geojensis TaxID=443610 RepID=A0A0F5FXE1_9HYPH|nr:alpha-amylase family protein [Devosia geojensis]KKB12857.1 trehalose synthase [Devosia geojensis]
MPNLWYKNAVIYCLDVETFMDSNGDGVGDFAGLAHRLDHLERLGVTCIWLTPFYPSPNRDNGYDVTDYYNVDPRYGTLGDFVEFMHAADDRGMRVIIDLVVNHTSIDHPWFQSARSSPDSPYRDWYVWSKTKPANITDGVVFPGVQKSIWSRDRKAKAWYLHRFYSHQADLNVRTPAVREEILRIMGFWLALGVSGFRIDAVPFLVEPKGPASEGNPDPYAILSEMHDFMSWRKAGAAMLAEANITYDVANAYFGAGERMSMIFDFLLNQYLFLSLARRSAAPLRRALKDRPMPGGMGQWATFLRNHDEIDLARLSRQEREECYAAFGPKPDMQLYGRGLRRRLAGMLDGDEARLKLAFSLLFAMPGTPVLWFGDEIGMGENLSLPERNAVRTPMQWSDERNGGFSSASADELIHPMQANGRFGYKQVNVSEQVRRPGSLMHVVAAMIGTRRSTPEIGWGEPQLIDVGNDDILVVSYLWRENRVITVHNFTQDKVRVPLKVEGVTRYMPLLMSSAPLAPFAANEPTELPPFGYCWLRCEGERR